MKAGVVAPDAGVWIDGENGGEKLREKEEKKGNIKRSFFENEFLLRDTFKNPESRNNYSEKIYKEHFVKLKNFTSLRPEEKGSEEEKREEAEAEKLVNFVCFGHGNSLAFTKEGEVEELWLGEVGMLTVS